MYGLKAAGVLRWGKKVGSEIGEKRFKVGFFSMLASMLDQIQRTKVGNITINVRILFDVHYVLVIKLMKNINEKTT